MKKLRTKTKKNKNYAGVMRNDLPGFMRVIGNKIYVRYNGKDISTGCDNTSEGWKMANDFWAKSLLEIETRQANENAKLGTIGAVFEKFLEYKIKFHKIMPKTVTFYKTGINAVFTKQDNNLTANEIKVQIMNFVEYSNISDASINIYLRAVNGFLNWAANNKYIPKENYINDYKRKTAIKVKAPYTQQDYELLLSYFKGTNFEMYLFIQFLWLTGSRCGEALTIKLSDLDLKNNRILVPNKIFKGEQEFLLLIPEVITIIEQIKLLASNRNDTKLFSWKNTRLPNKIMERAERNLEIKIKGRGLHGFRRGFADRLFSTGLDIPDVQEIMRHRDIKTTIGHYKTIRQQELIKKMKGKL